MVFKEAFKRCFMTATIPLFLFSCVAPVSSPPSTAPPIISKSFALSKSIFTSDIPAQSVLSIAVDPANRLLIGKERGIEVLSRDGAVITLYSARNSQGQPVIEKPSDIAITKDRIYVIDSTLHKVAVFSSDGAYLDSFGVRGNGAKEFSSPSALAVYDGTVFVADSGNKRIQVFGPNGVYLKSIGPNLTVKSEKAKQLLLEKPPPFDPVKEELEKIKIILQQKPSEKESEKTKTISLQKPASIGIDHRGLIYIVDSGDNTVKICDQQGEYMGQLPDVKEPFSIVLGPDAVYVADLSTYAILKYDFDGKFLYAFGSRGAGPGQFGGINDISMDKNGNLYIADGKRGLIHVFASEQGPSHDAWQKMPPPSSVEWIQEYPVKAGNIAHDGKESLYAVDGKTIYRIKDGTLSTVLAREEIAPVAVDVDKDGFIWVLDGFGKQVVKMDSEGAIINKFFQLTDKNLNRSSKPRDIVVSGKDVVYVADSGNKWIWLQSFQRGAAPFSNLIRTDKAGNSLENPVSLALDKAENLYVLDDLAFGIHIFSPTGEPLSGFTIRGKVEKPTSLAVIHNEIFVLDAGKENIKVFGSDGTLLREFGARGIGKGDFKNPEGIAAKDDFTFFVADSGNHRIQAFKQRNSPEMPAEVAVKDAIQRVEIAWKQNVERFPITYQIYRTDSWDAPYSLVGTTSENRYNDREVKPGRKYYYRISALANNGNESLKSNPLMAQPSIYTPKSPKELKAEPYEWSVDLSWKSEDKNLVALYVIYRQMGNQKYEIGKTRQPFYKDTSLSPNMEYAYLVTAVSSDGTEGPPALTSTKTKVATKDPIEISVLEMQDIFSNAYKIYEDEWIGRIRILNNSGDSISNMKISFMIKEFMDFSAQVEVKDLKPGKTYEVYLKAIFNNKILDVTEDSPVQTEIKASYYWNNQPREFTRNHAVTIYEKHRIMWNARERFAAFITPKDPIVLEFVRSIVTQYGKIESNIQRAAMVFNAISLMGITYLPDPNNPYQITSGKTDFVDYLQYPRETLKRKSGDCDDLVALYCSALESMGISTKAVEIPGHMLMMFSTDIESDKPNDTMNGLFVIHLGRLWLPVETTLIGSSFEKAWEKGSTAYYQWEKNGLTTLDIRGAWQRFKPASLPGSDWRPASIQRASIDSRFPDALDTLKNIELKLQTRKYYEMLAQKPEDAYSLNQIGIIYGKAGAISDAFKAFEKVLTKDPSNAIALNNKANVLFISGKYDEASRFYEKASSLDPKDPLVWVNQARCFQQLKNMEKAKKAFRKAYEIDQSVAIKYRMMALELLGSN